MRYLLLMALAAPSLAVADSYDTHAISSMYREKPCTSVVGLIDNDTAPFMAERGAIWGFLVGYDQANGGLRGDQETTLIRLRKACAESPKTPALELLNGFID